MLHKDTGSVSDGALLQLFISQRDEAAFEALVRRHGPMVAGVCRRVLRNLHDAQDAFQATFLVLVRKANSVHPREMVGNWLYGVALRTALEAKRAAARRRARERKAGEMPRANKGNAAWEELLPALDEELARLPDKYRVALVLCDLEGKSRKEAAFQLGWPEGTVASRLVRARTMLAKRLAPYGRALSSGAVAGLLSQNAASACMSSGWIVSTVKAASQLAAGHAANGVISANVAALIEGVSKAMLLSKIKIATALLMSLVLGCYGLGMLIQSTSDGASSLRAAASQPAPDEKPAGKKNRNPLGKSASRAADDNAPKKEATAAKPEKQGADKGKTDKEKIQGTWIIVSLKAWDDKGKEAEGEAVDKIAQLIKEKKLKVMFTGEKLTISGFGDEMHSSNYKLDPSKKPKTIDAVSDKETRKGIYSLDGKELKLCFGTTEFQRSSPDDKEKVIPGARPKDFTKQPGAELWVCNYVGPAK
jgi:RNA polymerase sigma-70 factor (ECF subfamily)